MSCSYNVMSNRTNLKNCFSTGCVVILIIIRSANVDRLCTRRLSSLPVAPSSWQCHGTTTTTDDRAWCIDWMGAGSTTSFLWVRAQPEGSRHSQWRTTSTCSSYVHSTLRQTWQAHPSTSTWPSRPCTSGSEHGHKNSTTENLTNGSEHVNKNSSTETLRHSREFRRVQLIRPSGATTGEVIVYLFLIVYFICTLIARVQLCWMVLTVKCQTFYDN